MSNDTNPFDNISNGLQTIRALLAVTRAMALKAEQENKASGFAEMRNEKGELDLKGVQEEAIPQLLTKGFKTIEIQGYLKEAVRDELQRKNVECAIFGNRTNNNVVLCYHESQEEEFNRALKRVVENCKYYPVSKEYLKSIQKTIPKSKMCKVGNLSSFDLHQMIKRLPNENIYFSCNINHNGTHEIFCLSPDWGKVKECLKDTVAYELSDDGTNELKSFAIEEVAFNNIEEAVKDGKEAYVISEESKTMLKVSPNGYMVFTERIQGMPEIMINKVAERNVFENNTWDNLSIQIVAMKNPIVLTPEEFASKNREEIMTQHLEEIDFRELQSASPSDIFNQFELDGYEESAYDKEISENEIDNLE